jgi:predicted Zn-dependent protease
MNLQQFNDVVRKVARRTGLDDYELFLTLSTSLSARIENREITLQLKNDIFSGSLRVLRRGKLGFVPFTEPSPAVLELGIKICLNMAAPAPFSEFAVIPERLPALTAFDPAVARLLNKPAQIKNLAQELIERAFATGKINTLEGMIHLSQETRLIATMHSPQPVIADRTAFSAFAEINSQDFDFVAGRKLPETEQVVAIGENVARNLPGAETTPEAEGMKGKTVPVILDPVFTEELLRRLVAEHLYAATVQEGMSKYRRHEPVMSELITLYDDATAPFGETTFPVDDEGTPAQRNLIVENGILKTFLYDRTTAARDGVQSTGNGRRRPVLIEEEHEAPIRCTINDIFITPGTTPLAEIIRDIEHGLLVKVLLGFHTANRTTGDFANTLYFGRIIRNGELAQLPQAGRWAIRGNALEVMRRVSQLSQETKATGSAVLPWLRTELAVG